MSKKPINSRRKGKDGELEAVRLLKPYFPDCKRSFGQARSGTECSDIINTGDFWIEVKRRKRITETALGGFIKKALSDWDGRTPWMVLLYRQDRAEWSVWAYARDQRTVFTRSSFKDFARVWFAAPAAEEEA